MSDSTPKSNPRPTPDLDDPRIQIDLDDPVIRAVSEIIRQVQGEPWFEGLRLDTWLESHQRPSCQGQRKGKANLVQRQWNQWFKTAFEVAARAYELGAQQHAEPLQRPPEAEGQPAGKLYSFVVEAMKRRGDAYIRGGVR